MRRTSIFRKASETKQLPLRECHGGQGVVDWTDVLSGSFVEGRRLNFLHDDILKPGVTIGIHTHKSDEEYYYILSGHGIMTLDGETHQVGPGDIAAVFPGGSHGLMNDSKDDMRIIVLSVS
ncbi:MAG: cupin domain-containing protein [Deltaproteobacteria bacterium]|nr:MAG: cupin domain-containing protein [Deltaproteobacteria bacterium]